MSERICLNRDSDGTHVETWCARFIPLSGDGHEIDLDCITCGKCIETAMTHHELWVSELQKRHDELKSGK